MKKTIKSILALILSVLVLFSCFSSVGILAYAEEYTEFDLYGENTVSFDYRKETVTFVITPKQNGEYTFYTDCEYDADAELYDSGFYSLAEATDIDAKNGNYNFKLTYYLYAYNTYYLEITNCDKGGISFPVYTVLPECLLESFELNRGDFSILAGREESISVENVLPEYVEYVDYKWTSDNEDVATVVAYDYDNKYATVCAVSEGTATITVTAHNGISRSVKVNVVGRTKLSVSEELQFEITDPNGTAYAEFTPEESGQYRIYTVSDYTVYIDSFIDSNDSNYGAFYPEDGKTEISREICLSEGVTYNMDFRSYDGNSGKFKVGIERIISVDEVEILYNGKPTYSLTAVVGDTFRLEAEVLPENATNKGVRWESGNTEIATVSEDGTVEITGVGSTDIVVHTIDGDYTSQLWITARKITASLEVGAEITAEYLTEEDLYFSFTPEDSGNYIIYSSERGDFDPYVTVYNSDWENIGDNNDYYDSDGILDWNFRIVKYFEAGKTYYIQTSINNVIGAHKVGVKKAAAIESFEISGIDKQYVGKISTFNIYNQTPADSGTPSLNWTCSDSSAAKITVTDDTVAQIEWLKAGVFTLTATDKDGAFAQYVVTVSDAKEIKENITETATFTYNNETVAYKFIPETSGKYEFYSSNVVGNTITTINLYSATDHLYSSGESYPGKGSTVQYYLDAGSTYFVEISASFYDMETSEYDFTVVKTVPAESIIINSGTDKITGYIGNDMRLNITSAPDHSNTDSIEWSSSAEDIVSVNSDGYIYFRNEGTAVITAKISETVFDTITVNVKLTPELQVNVPLSVIIPNSSTSVDVIFTPSVSGKYVFYSSGELNAYANLYNNDGWLSSCISLDDNKNFKLAYELEAGVTYTLSVGYYDSIANGEINLAVVPVTPATSIQLDTHSVNIFANSVSGIRFNIAPFTAELSDITITSNDESIATVKTLPDDNYFEVIGVSGGSTFISVSSKGGASVTLPVTVKPVYTLYLDRPQNINITDNGERIRLTFTAPKTGKYDLFSHNLLDTATINIWNEYYNNTVSLHQGNSFCDLVELTEGVTYIIETGYQSVEKTGSYDLFITEVKEPESLIINNGEESVKGYKGDSIQLSLGYFPAHIDNSKIVWYSTDDTVATVDQNGYVTLLSTGDAYIVAYYNEQVWDDILIKCIDYPSLSLNIQQTLPIKENYEISCYQYVAESSGTYILKFRADQSVHVQIYDSNWTPINSVGAYDLQLSFNAVEGETYYFKFRHMYLDYSGTVDVILESKPAVTNLEIVQYPDKMTYYEGETQFEYWGLILKATLSNGNSVYWNYNQGDLAGYEVFIDCSFSDGVYSGSAIRVGTASVTFSFNILENPVAKFELYSGNIKEFVENIGGYWNGSYYQYQYYQNIVDLVFKITYTDGRTDFITVNDNINDASVTYSSNEPWSVGSDNYITFTYLGHSIDVPVTVIENPVEKIEINNAPSADIMFGDYEYGSLGPDGIYYIYLEDLEGFSFTVYYKNGTQKTFTAKDAIIDYDCYYWDGYAGYFMECPVEKAGDATFTFNYLGHTAEVSINIKESNVSSVEIVKDPDITEINGNLLPDFYGMQIKITYTDGTSEIVTVTEENSYFAQEGYIVSFSNEKLTINNYGYRDAYLISYMGVTATFDKITYIDSELPQINVSDITLNGVGTVFNIDGEEYKITSIYTWYREYAEGYNYFYGVGSTGKGYFEFGINVYADENGYISNIMIENNVGMMDILVDSGDINGDGSIDVRDLVAMKKAAAGTKNAANKTNGDMNLNGKIDSSDLAVLRKRLLGKPADLDIWSC